VRPGESIVTIARKLRVNRIDLAEANHLSVRSRLKAGQALIIPRAPATILAARSDRPAPPAVPASRATRSGSAAEPAVRASAQNGGAPRATTYRVRRGDTLISIARQFHTTVANLKEWNGLRSSHIRAGERLTIFATAAR
jgi:membrane-bound lytic murein transglycosylase D